MKKALRGQLYYESLTDSGRMKLSRDFDVEYDGKGDREHKFHQWVSDKFRFNINHLK